MDADVLGCLKAINKSYKAFEHKGQSMTKKEVQAVLTYAYNKGYKAVSELSDEEINNVLSKIK
jgi:hypothetical protein